MGVWVDREKERGKEKRPREWDKERAEKLLFAGTYVRTVTCWGYLVG
jgi:hypothetical protein